MTGAEIIALLDLAPHPEGGWYRQTFRDAAGPEGRGASTAIYFSWRPVRKAAGIGSTRPRSGITTPARRCC